MSLPGDSSSVVSQITSWLRGLGLVLLLVVLVISATVWIVKAYVLPSEFRPVSLSAQEERTLDTKLERLEGKPYQESDTDREIVLSEREVNALLAKNADLARRVAIDLSGDLVSAELLILVDEDFPMFGGRTIRVRAGVVLDYKKQRPVVALKGVSIMGVPVPNAWLGGLKNIDLVGKFGGDEGLWEAFAAGVEDLEVSDGRLRIKLKK